MQIIPINPNFSRLLFFTDVVLVSNYHGCNGEAIKFMPYYMIDIINKTVKPSYLKKLQMEQNIKKLMFQLIFIFSGWILIKQIIVSSNPFCCWEKQIFERILNGGMSSFLLPREWWQELAWEFWMGRVMIKSISNQCVS